MAKTGHNGNGHHHGHVTETPDVSHIKNLDVTHEASDVNVGGIVKFMVGLTIFTVIVYILMWGMFRLMNAQEQKKEPQPGPMARTEAERRPPDPKLQAAPGFGVKLANGEWVPLENREPEAEYRVLRDQWDSQLNCSDLAYADSACLPIDKAIQQLFEGQGLPSRTKTIPEGGPGGRAEDYGIDAPTAASSGRATARRGQ